MADSGGHVAAASRPLRVLHIVPSYHPAIYFGGPTVSLYQLCNHLAVLRGVELRVLTTDTSGPRRRDRLDPVQMRAEGFPGYRVWFHRKLFGGDFSPSLLAAILPSVAWADVVHVTAVYSTPTPFALLAARLLRKPVVWSPRGALQRWADSRRPGVKRLWDSLCNLLLNPRNATLHVTSAEEAEESVRRIPGARPVVIPNGVEAPPSMRNRDWLPGGRLRLLYLGRLDPKKGIENLLQALAQIRDESVRLRVCGGGEPAYEESLRRLALDLGLAHVVEFVGPITGEVKSREFLSADLCVVPSHTENFGMVIAEALAHGTPVIASRGTPWSELESQGAGFWVSNEPESLARTIARARSANLEALGYAGRQWMAQAFGWPSVAERMMKAYRELASSAAMGQ